MSQGLSTEERMIIAVIQKTAISKYRSAEYQYEKERIIRDAIYEGYVSCKVKEKDLQS